MVTLTRSQRRELDKAVEQEPPVVTRALPPVSKSRKHETIAGRKANVKSNSSATTKAPPSPVASDRVAPDFSGHSIEPVIAYSRSCVSDKRNCDDGVIEEMLRHCKAHVDRWSEYEWNQVLVSFDQHLENQNYGRIGMMSLIDLLMDLIRKDRAESLALTVLVRVAVSGSEYLDRVCVKIFETRNTEKNFPILFGIIDRLGIRECTGFVVNILTNHILTNEDSKFAIQFATDLCVVFRDTFSIEAFFVVQICVVHLLRQLVSERPSEQSRMCEVLISMIGKFAHMLSQVMVRFADCNPALLPAHLFPLNDKAKDVKFCGIGDCGPMKMSRPHRKDTTYFLESNDLYECEQCKNLFRRTCDNCASCPIENCCWGCGYRLVASGGDPRGVIQTSVNEKLVGLFLVLSQTKSMEQKKFALLYALDVAKIDFEVDRDALMRGISAESSFEKSAPPFAPSTNFTEEILFKLVLGEKISFLFDLIFKSLVPLLGDPVTATAAAKELKSLSVDSVKNMIGIADLILQQIRDASIELKSLNALVGFLEHMAKSCSINGNDILEIFHIHRRIITTNTKKIIVRVFVSVSDWETSTTACESFLDHLTSELDLDWPDLFDQFIESVWGRFGSDASLWSRILPLIADNCFIRDRLGVALSPHQRSSIALGLCRERKGYGMVEYVVGLGKTLDDTDLMHELMLDVLDTDELTGDILGALAHAIGKNRGTNPTSSQIHLRVFEKLRREIFLSKQLGVVGEGAKVLVVMTKFFQFSPDLINEVGKICSDSLARSSASIEPAAVIRAAVILSSLIENGYVSTLEKISEWSDCVLSVYDQLPRSIGVSLVAQILCNSGIRESYLTRLGPNFFETLIADFPDSTIGAVASILESALVESSEETLREIERERPRNPSDRPDQGVNCRVLASLFPSIKDTLLDTKSSPEIIHNCIRAVNAFVTLGIVNPRSVPAVLMARYVLSCDGPEVISCDGLLNTQDLNMFAIRGVAPIDSQMIRFTLTSLFTTVLEKISSAGIASEIYRMVELCFPESHSTKRLINKDGSRFCVDYCVEELIKNSENPNEEKSIFLICVLVIGAVSVGCIDSVMGRLSSTLGVSEERTNTSFSYSLRFALVALRDAQKEALVDRFGFIETMVKKFSTKEMTEIEEIVLEEPIVVGVATNRKRGRESMATKRGKRRKKSVAFSDEFTSGDSSSDHEEC